MVRPVIELRPYQHGASPPAGSAAVTRRVLYVAPTGSGKTVLFAWIAAPSPPRASAPDPGAPARAGAPDRRRSWPSSASRAGFVVAGKPIDLDPPITVAAVQTLRVRPNLELAYDLVVIDEAHHVVPGSTWSLVLDRMPDAMVLGVTATPERLDGKGLGDSFDAMVPGPSVKALQADGYLALAACYRRDGAVDALRSIRKLGGDFHSGELARLMMELPCTAAAIVDYRELGAGRPGFAFCCTVAHAEAVAQAFTAAGIRGRIGRRQDGRGERDDILAAFAAGELGVLSSCELLSEGFDAPEASVALLLRPTLSPGALPPAGRPRAPTQGRQRQGAGVRLRRQHQAARPADHGAALVVRRPREETGRGADQDLPGVWRGRRDQRHRAAGVRVRVSAAGRDRRRAI